MSLPVITVASLEEADALLSGDNDTSKFPNVVSISHELRGSRPKSLKDTERNVLYLTFDDVEEKNQPNPPKVSDVLSILDFSAKARGSILCHCMAGISRSSATAVIINRALMGRGREKDAVSRVLQSVHRNISPNALMIQMADKILECDGSLVEAVKLIIHKKDVISKVGDFW